jgi:outer membrane receptor protein involved in Fe transport
VDEQPIVLSPFVVEASEDASSYRATATLAGTRIRTELKDVGSAVSAVTAQFLQDTGARNTQDLLVYTTNTEVGGISGNFAGAGNGAVIDTQAQRASPQTNTRVRGLANADNTRDFFLTDIPWDAYIV